MPNIGDVVLEVDDYSHPTEFADIGFTLRSGEILGFYGLVGRRALGIHAGAVRHHPASGGTIRIDGQDGRDPFARRRGRQRHRLRARGSRQAGRDHRRCRSFRTSPCRRLSRTSRNGFLRLAEEFKLARDYTERLDLRAASLDTNVGKPVGRQPAEGRDRQMAGDAAEGHHPRRADQGHRHRLEGRGARVHGRTRGRRALPSSWSASEIPEVLGMSDRIIVMREGRIVAEVDRRCT